MKKFFVLAVAFIFLALSLPACRQIERIAVMSVDYPDLKAMRAGEFNAEWADTWYFVDEAVNPYYDYECVVSVKNNQLLIEKSREEPSVYDCVFAGRSLAP